MPLLNQGNTQQPSGGLLGNDDPQMNQLMQLAMLKSLRSRGGKSDRLAMILKMQKAEYDAARQQQMDALRFRDFERSEQRFQLDQNKYQRELDDYNQKRNAQQGLINEINNYNDQPQSAASTPAPVPSVIPQEASIPEEIPAPQAQPNQAPLNPLENAAKEAMPAQADLPKVTSQKELQDAFASVSPVDNQGKPSPGAINKKKYASLLVQMGQPTAAMQMLKGDYGTPITVSNTNGERKLIQIDSDGQIREVQGYMPANKEDVAPTGYTWTDQGNPSAGLKAIPGGPAAKTDANEAGRQQMVIAANNNLGQVTSSIIDPSTGKVDRGLVASMFANVPFSKGRLVRAQMEDAIAAKLRLETGAQANPSEIVNMRDRYLPSPLDSDATIKDKLTRFTQFMQGASKSINTSYGKEPSASTQAEQPTVQVKQSKYNPEQLESMANEAIKAGRDPKAVQEMLIQMRGY